MTKYHVLSLNGGGVRGVFSAKVLERLAIDVSQLYAVSGTSTGAIIACALLSGYSPGEIVDFFKELAPKIFKRQWWAVGYLDHIFAPPYDLKNAQEVFQQFFGTKRLGDFATKVLIVSYDLSGKINGVPQAKVKVLHNFDTAGHDKDHFVWEACVKSMAALTYFKPYQNRWTDGGFIENHSGLALAAQMTATYGGLNCDDADIRMLSIGTAGVPPYLDPKQKHKWGIFESGQLAIETIAASNVAMAEWTLLGKLDGYHRVDKPMPTKVKLDAVAEIPALIRWAEALDLAETRRWLQAFFPASGRRASVVAPAS